MLIDAGDTQIFSITFLEFEEIQVFSIGLARDYAFSSPTMRATLQIELVLKHFFIS